jgi:predicted ATPase|tara:strand:+ start:3229 stop:3372 length:144 start_codon:yes stop_codon:yes gene_type:complete
MPNRAAKSRKQLKQKLNAKWKKEGRTANQHKKWKAKNPTNQRPQWGR